MNQIAPVAFASDPYFHDIIREMESIEPESTRMPRRDFIKLAGIAGVGLVLGFSIGGIGARSAAAATPAGDAVLNAYIRIAPGGEIILYNKAPEIGQGIKTSFPMILAEHLDANWSDVRIEQAPINPAVYGRQSAGGSRSTPTGWEPLRRAGATARAMLIAAAAKQWGVPESECEIRTARQLWRARVGRRADAGARCENRAHQGPQRIQADWHPRHRR
jgi:isoquinoline 1-oxidoreductase subunit beta